MTMFKLTAEREACEPIEFCSNERLTLEQAFLFFEGVVEGIGEDRWPCGYDAVLRSSDGRAWLLADEWEEFE